MLIDTVDEGFAGIDRVTHGQTAVVASDLFSHPVPEILNRIEVGTVGRQRDESEVKFGSGYPNGFRLMPSGTVPRDKGWARPIMEPVGQRLAPLVHTRSNLLRSPSSRKLRMCNGSTTSQKLLSIILGLIWNPH